MSPKVRLILLALGAGWAVAVLVTLTTMGNPVDALCYYGSNEPTAWDPRACFVYSPPLGQLIGLIRPILPFEVFVLLLRSLEMLVLAAVAGPALLFALFIPAVAIELNAANINLLIVGAVLLGFRYPFTWAFVILTKVSPGIGLLWFAVRREWRNLGIALAATVAVAGVSFLAAPELWPAYFKSVATTPDDSIWLIGWRLPIAALVVVWGARNDHKWALMVAVFLAMPRWYFLSPVILVGLFPLVELARPLPNPARWLAARRSQPAAATSDGRTMRAPSS